MLLNIIKFLVLNVNQAQMHDLDIFHVEISSHKRHLFNLDYVQCNIFLRHKNYASKCWEFLI